MKMSGKAAARVRAVVFNDASHTVFYPSKLNVFIGANNSGKSRLLREIRGHLLGLYGRDNVPHAETAPLVVVDSVEIDLPDSFDEFNDIFDLDNKVIKDESGSSFLNDYCSVGLQVNSDNAFIIGSPRTSYSEDWEGSLRGRYPDNKQELLSFVGPGLVEYCGTEERLVLSAGQRYYGVLDNDINLLSSRYRTDSSLEALSHQTIEHFRRYVVFDTETRGGVIQLRVGNSFGLYEDRGSTSGHHLRIQDGSLLKDEGDGFRSFCMVYLSLDSQKPVLLIDEPESFLHPPQAFALGRIVGERVAEMTNVQLFVATHSSRFLEGILSVGGIADDTKLLRLNRESSVKESPLSTATRIMKDPLFMTSHLFDGLFSRKTIVVESEGDECVYRRLLAKLHPAEDVVLVNVHSKDRVHDAVSFFKAMGTPCGAIVDFDILNDVNTFQTLLRAFECGDVDELVSIAKSLQSVATRSAQEQGTSVMSAIVQNLGDLEGLCIEDESAVSLVHIIQHQFEEYVESGHSPLRSKRIWKTNVSVTFGEHADRLTYLFEKCQRLGLLIVDSGELETVFEPDVPYTHNKKEWLPKALAFIDEAENDLLRQYPISRALDAILLGMSSC